MRGLGAGEGVADERGVAADAANEGRREGVLEQEADEGEARDRVDQAPAGDRPAVGGERNIGEPSEVGAEAGRPHDGGGPVHGLIGEHGVPVTGVCQPGQGGDACGLHLC